MRKIAVVPAYEPPESFLEYAEQLLKMADCLVVVDDGSGERFRAVFQTIRAMGAQVISYDKNRGKGYALKQAFAWCAQYYSREDIIVTADCDGQHSVQDVVKVMEAAAAQPDSCILGARDFTQSNVPARSRAGNTQMRRLLKLLYGIAIYDSQTGLRAFSVATAQAFCQVSGDRFEYETGTLIYASRHGIPVREVGIQTIYPAEPKDHVSHFKGFRDSCRVVWTLAKNMGGVAAAALVSTVADIGIFTLLTQVVFSQVSPLYTMLATVTARAVSSLLHFFISCKKVFHGQPRRAILRYYLVLALYTGCSYGVVCLFGHGLGGHLTLVKLIGDACLGLLSYQLQCRWVYKKPNDRDFYGPFARFARQLLRIFSPQYRCDIPQPQEPVVYVCRHLNMHGPYTTLKWLPFHVHPMVIHIFFDRKAGAKHLTEYTFSKRYNKKPRKFDIRAQVVAAVTQPLVRSLQSVPVYRGSGSAVTTLKKGLEYLQKGENLIVFPDVDYTGSYDQPTDIYHGFLYLGELYFRKTGRVLPFVPLTLDDENRQILAGEPVTLCDFRTEGAAAAEAIRQAIQP